MPQQTVSVIIPCYNHGRYLKDAIESVQSQGYNPIEIIVVDDGSVDDTKLIAEKYADVKYVYQTNQGLSTARNTGIKNSTGELLIFLDADDWLLPNAVFINLKLLTEKPKVAFVSGAHQLYFQSENVSQLIQNRITKNHYANFLAANYVGMHASVMYQRWVFNEFQFDTLLKYCEDYDLYLKIARKFPVIHHTEPIASYRLHKTNMSRDSVGMLKSVLFVLRSQEKLLQNNIERQHYKKGIKSWKSYYTKKIYDKLVDSLFDKKEKITKLEIVTFLLNSPYLYKGFIAKTTSNFKLIWNRK